MGEYEPPIGAKICAVLIFVMFICLNYFNLIPHIDTEVLMMKVGKVATTAVFVIIGGLFLWAFIAMSLEEKEELKGQKGDTGIGIRSEMTRFMELYGELPRTYLVKGYYGHYYYERDVMRESVTVFMKFLEDVKHHEGYEDLYVEFSKTIKLMGESVETSIFYKRRVSDEIEMKIS